MKEFQEYFNTPRTTESRKEYIKNLSFEKYIELICMTLNKAGFKKKIRDYDENYKYENYDPYIDIIIVDVIKDHKALDYLKKVQLLDNGRCPECGNTMRNEYKFTSGFNPKASYYICKKCYKEGEFLQRTSTSNKRNSGCMIALSIVFIIIFIGSFLSCNQQQNNKTIPSDKSINRDKDYYESKEYQTFSDYQFAVKCPVILKDVSMQSNDDFDFNYAGSIDDTFYQIMIIKLPAGYKDYSTNEIKFMLKERFSQQGGGENVLFGEEDLPAYLLNDYSQEGHKGRGIAVYRNGKIYVFNVMTTADLDNKFNSFTNNIKFINNEDANSYNKVQEENHNSTKYAVAVINYKESYQKIKKSYPFSGEEEESYKLVWDISNVLEVSSNLTKNDKQRLLDDRFENKMVYIGKNILIDKELYLFDSYSEASKFMVEKRRLYNE